MRFSFYFLLVAFLPVVTYSQDFKFTPLNSVILKKHQGKQVMRQMSRCMYLHCSKFFDISQLDKEQMENQMKMLYKLNDVECHDQVLHRLDNLSNYFYQYIGVIHKGKKYIYINAFDAKHVYGNWRTVPVVVGDGGLAYWGVYFDLKDNLFRYLAFNHTIMGESRDPVRNN